MQNGDFSKTCVNNMKITEDFFKSMFQRQDFLIMYQRLKIKKIALEFIFKTQKKKMFA